MRYHYVTLSYQEKLGSGEPKPFAVLVETTTRHDRRVYIYGRRLAGDHESIMGEVLFNIPAILRERIEESLIDASEHGGLALARVRKEFAWNIRSSKPRWGFALSSAEGVTERLFSKFVETEKRHAEDTAARRLGTFFETIGQPVPAV